MKLKPSTVLAVVIIGVGSLYAAPDPLLTPRPVSATFGRIGVTEMMIRVKMGREKIVGDARHVLHLQQLARKSKDVIKLNCVNDKYIQLKAEMNLAERSADSFEHTNEGMKIALFDDFNTHVESVRRLREQADLCVGEPVIASESANDWHGPDVRDNPFKNPWGPQIEPPGYASPIN